MADEPSKQDWAVLDLKPGARPAQVQRAYQRRRALYERDTLATYTLLSAQERSQMLERIDLAYRRIMGQSPASATRATGAAGARVRRTVPSTGSRPEARRPGPPPSPREIAARAEETPGHTSELRAERKILPPPPTAPPARPLPTAPVERPKPAPKLAPKPAPAPAPEPAPKPAPRPTPKPPVATPQPEPAGTEPDPAGEPGAYLRFHRRRRRISIEAVADETKISILQLEKLEEESIVGLPAEVYVRGFIIQYARFLGLPEPEKLAGLYLDYLRTKTSGSS